MRDVRVGMLGLGTVGLAVARRLRDDAALITRRAGVRIELAGVVVRDVERGRGRLPGTDLVTADADGLLADESLDVIVELIGGVDPAHDYIERALRAGRSVVTGNKAVIAMYGEELLAVGGARLRFEAAVGGGVPVIEALRGGLAGQRVSSIDAVINGTTNLMLDAMAAGGPYADALRDAQERGFAEADPSADVGGFDAACKLAILASLAGDTWIRPDAVARTGITGLRPGDFRAAWLCGHCIRLLSSARFGDGAATLRVEPTALRRAPSPHSDHRAIHGHPLADLLGPENGVVITGDMSGPLLMRGAGAGADATAGAVVADIIALARGAAAMNPGHGGAPSLTVTGGDGDDTAAMIVVETGARDADLAVVRQLLADRGVVTRSAARDTEDTNVLLAALITKPAPRPAIAAAVATLDADPRFEDGVRWFPAA